MGEVIFSVFIFLIFVSVVIAVVHILARDRSRYRARVRSIIDDHLQALSRRRSQLVRLDDYGVEVDKSWIKEMNYFFEKVIMPNVEPRHRQLAQNDRTDIMQVIDFKARQNPIPSREASRTLAKNGIEFEQQCQAVLAGQGWSARLTSASGDQGADIVAEKGGMSVVLQCKLYARPVGNKAVQEVAAARTYYDAGFAAVVSNADYTEAARRLARRNEVLLLHIDDLHDLEDKLRDPAWGPADRRG